MLSSLSRQEPLGHTSPPQFLGLNLNDVKEGTIQKLPSGCPFRLGGSLGLTILKWSLTCIHIAKAICQYEIRRNAIPSQPHRPPKMNRSHKSQNRGTHQLIEDFPHSRISTIKVVQDFSHPQSTIQSHGWFMTLFYPHF